MFISRTKGEEKASKDECAMKHPMNVKKEIKEWFL